MREEVWITSEDTVNVGIAGRVVKIEAVEFDKMPDSERPMVKLRISSPNETAEIVG